LKILQDLAFEALIYQDLARIPGLNVLKLAPFSTKHTHFLTKAESLPHYLQNLLIFPDYPAICDLFCQIIHQVKLLHSAGYIHGNINPENIVVVQDRAYLWNWSSLRTPKCHSKYTPPSPPFASDAILLKKHSSPNARDELESLIYTFHLALVNKPTFHFNPGRRRKHFVEARGARYFAFSEKDEDLDVLHRMMYDAWDLVVNSNANSSGLYHQLVAIFTYDEDSDESEDSDSDVKGKGSHGSSKKTEPSKKEGVAKDTPQKQ
jgi:serine/threonine protein kinase